MTELVEKYWDAIYPLPDEDDPYDRIASLGGLNGIEAEGSLIVPIRTIAITNGEEAYSYSDYVQACEHERLSSDEAKKERLDLGATSLEMITKSVKESPENFYPELKSEIEETIAAFKRLSDLFDEIIDGDSLPTSYILKSLQDSLLAIQHIAKDVFEKITQDQARDQMALEHSEDEVEVGGHGQVSTDDNNGPVKNRAMALKKLEELATFFRNTEPHSPMSYGIEQIVFWAGLTLPELLKELIVDDDARMTYFKLSGITTPEDADEASGQMGARGQMDARGGPQGFDQRPVERL